MIIEKDIYGKVFIEISRLHEIFRCFIELPPCIGIFYVSDLRTFDEKHRGTNFVELNNKNAPQIYFEMVYYHFKQNFQMSLGHPGLPCIVQIKFNWKKNYKSIWGNDVDWFFHNDDSLKETYDRLIINEASKFILNTNTAKVFFIFIRLGLNIERRQSKPSFLMMNLPDNDLLAKKIQGSYISCDVKGQNVLFSSKINKKYH